MLSIRINSVFFHIFGMMLISTFVPVKIYPIFFVLACIVFAFQIDVKLHVTTWLYFILLLSFQVFILFLCGDKNIDIYTAFLKYIIGVSQLILVVHCKVFGRDDGEGLGILSSYLNVIVILLFAQIFYLQISSGGFVFSSESSSAASKIFNSSKMLFGVNDKNIFGAKAALFGFLCTVTSYFLNKRLPISLMSLVFITCALSLSRTSILFYIISMVVFWVLIKLSEGKKLLVYSCAIFFLIVTILSMPIIATYLRLSSIANLEHGDGMSLRLIYWLTLLENYSAVGLFGNGMLAGANFLSRYSMYYNGEPNLHNLFLNNFLDFGVVGFFLYLIFFISFMRFMNVVYDKPKSGYLFGIPIFIMINTLYTTYDNDVWIYFSTAYIIARSCSNVNPMCNRNV
ncbi:O-antigen ligase family protein [Aeromonas veronii]